MKDLDLIKMQKESFHSDELEESFAIWYTDDNGEWQEYGCFHHDSYENEGQSAQERCCEFLAGLRDRMPYREYAVIKMEARHTFSLYNASGDARR